MERFPFVAGQLLIQLPVLVILLTSFIVVSTRRRAIGGRRATLSIAGLAVLTVDVVLNTVWIMVIPTLMARGNFEVSQIGVLSGAAGFLFAAMMATGIGLLVAAVVTPATPGSPPPQQPYPQTPPTQAAPTYFPPPQ